MTIIIILSIITLLWAVIGIIWVGADDGTAFKKFYKTIKNPKKKIVFVFIHGPIMWFVWCIVLIVEEKMIIEQIQTFFKNIKTWFTD